MCNIIITIIVGVILLLTLILLLMILLNTDHDQLFFLAYEKIKHVDDSLEPHMWTYRTRITLEHLRQSIHDKKLTQTYPILHEFLQAVSKHILIACLS